MEIPDDHFVHILLYYFPEGKNAEQARKKLYDVYGEKSFTERHTVCRMRKLGFKMIQSLQFSYHLNFFFKLKLIKF